MGAGGRGGREVNQVSSQPDLKGWEGQEEAEPSSGQGHPDAPGLPSRSPLCLPATLPFSLSLQGQVSLTSGPSHIRAAPSTCLALQPSSLP